MHGQGKTVHGVQASEFVDDAHLISQTVLVVHTGPVVGDLLIVIVGICQVAVERSPFGNVVLVTDGKAFRCLLAVPMVLAFSFVSASRIIFADAVQTVILCRCLEDTGTDLPIQPEQPVALAAVKVVVVSCARRRPFPALGIVVFILQGNLDIRCDTPADACTPDTGIMGICKTAPTGRSLEGSVIPKDGGFVTVIVRIVVFQRLFCVSCRFVVGVMP